MEICTDSLDLYVYLDLSFYLDNIKNNNDFITIKSKLKRLKSQNQIYTFSPNELYFNTQAIRKKIVL